MVSDVPVLFEELFVFFIFEIVQLIEVFVFEPVLMCFSFGLHEGLLDQWFRVLGLFGDNAMLAENVIPRAG